MIRTVRAVLLFALTLLAVGSCTLGEKRLSLAVSVEDPAAGIAEKLSTALADIDVAVDVVVVAEQADIIERVRNGELDLAIVEEPGRAIPDLMTLAPLYPSVLHILNSRANSDPGFAAVIRGASVYAGPAGGAAQRLLRQLTSDLNIGDDEYQLLENPWSQRPDVYFIIGGLLSKDSLAQFADYRLFSFAGADDLPGGTVADGIVLRHHHLHPFLIPKGVYPALTDDAILTLSVRSLLIAHQTFDEELGYNIARTLFGQSQEIAQLYPLVTMELNENARAADLMLPLHEGTRRFLDRDRPGFIERNVDVLALYLTILITLVTGAVAFLRHRAQARKDRVDVYYTKLIEIRDKMKTVPNDNRVIYNEVLGVQREVLDLLVEERIAADASLIAFVSLSNQLINELK